MRTKNVNNRQPSKQEQEFAIEYFRELKEKIARANDVGNDDVVVKADDLAKEDGVVKKDLVVKLSEEFLSSAAKSTSGTLAMAKSVVDAAALGERAFSRFCSLIGYGGKSSSIRKLRKIGELHDLFVENQSALPNSWTTLYSLTKLPLAELKDAFNGGKIKPNSTAKELAIQFPALAPRKPRASNSVEAFTGAGVPNGTDHYETRIHFPEVASAEQLDAFRKFLDWLRAESISVEVGDKLDEMLRDHPAAAVDTLPQAA